MIRLVALAAALGLLFLPLPREWSRGWRVTLLDFGHVPLFAALVFIWTPRDRPVWRTLLFAVALAGAVELVQKFVDRTADWGDFVRGAIGALCAALLILAWRSRRRPVLAVGCALLAAGSLAWPVLDSGPRLLDAYEGYRAFPVLADFRTDRELGRWWHVQASLSQTPDPAQPGRWVGRLDLTPGDSPYPTAGLEPVVGNFRRYRWLCCSIEVEGEPLLIFTSVRGGPVVDGSTVHYQVGRVYGPGPHMIRLDLPETAMQAHPEPLDLTDVRTVQFYTIRPKAVRTMLIRCIWLEP
jgi:hypothetical protein